MATRKKIKPFLAAFVVTLILIGAVCGFMLVDLSSDRYMPGEFEPFYLIEDVGPQGVTFYWMGQAYLVDAQEAGRLAQAAWDWRGLVPRSVRLAGGAARACLEFIERLAPPLQSGGA